MNPWQELNFVHLIVNIT